MSPVRVTFQPDGMRVVVPTGTTILEAARRAGIQVVAPCGGQGTCGRCRVLLSDRGSVLACQEVLNEETTVEIPVTARPDGTAVHVDCGLEPPDGREPFDPLVEAESRTPVSGLGLAVDIGTSTVASELIDLASGAVLARAGKANTQAAFGAEVTRRMEHAIEQGSQDLAEAIVGDLEQLTADLIAAAEADPKEIRTVVLAGNTPMIHFLYEIDSAPVLRMPHIPVAETPVPAPAFALGLRANPEARVHAFPWIGGWVGGDITAGILATGIHQDDRLTLFLDVGTNGEIVLGNREWRVACAASAGPAFEGCGIRDGMSARTGAIDRVSVGKTGALSVETIGGTKPRGLCGTGLISAVASFFRAGWIDRKGRIGPDHAEDVQGEKGIILARANRTAHERPIAIVQRDIDAVIRAKAALFAGIRSILGELDLTADRIERWIIAGGFGSRLDAADAIELGMIADVDPGKVEFAGNTSLRGARLALLHRSAWEEAQAIARSTTYLELIDRPGYFEEFTSACFLPHTDLTLFGTRPSRGTPERNVR